MIAHRIESEIRNFDEAFDTSRREPDRVDHLKDQIDKDYDLLFETLYEHEEKIERLEKAMKLLLQEIKNLLSKLDEAGQGGRA